MKNYIMGIPPYKNRLRKKIESYSQILAKHLDIQTIPLHPKDVMNFVLHEFILCGFCGYNDFLEWQLSNPTIPNYLKAVQLNHLPHWKMSWIIKSNHNRIESVVTEYPKISENFFKINNLTHLTITPAKGSTENLVESKMFDSTITVVDSGKTIESLGLIIHKDVLINIHPCIVVTTQNFRFLEKQLSLINSFNL